MAIQSLEVGDARVGRDGFLRLAFELRGARTVLTERLFTLPLQAMEPIPLDRDGSLLLMLLNPTGGLVGGDHLKTELTLGAGAHVCLTTPSATKVYRTLGPPAVQETKVSLGPGAVMEYLPDHVIPHPGAALWQSLSVELSPESLALLVDGVAFGRMARGERWRFGEIDSRMLVRADGVPCLIDRMRLNPEVRKADLPAAAARAGGLGGTEGFGYLASFVVVARRSIEWRSLSDELQRELESSPNSSALLSGVSLLARHGLVVRLLARTAYDLNETIDRLWSLSRRLLLDLPPLDLRKF